MRNINYVLKTGPTFAMMGTQAEIPKAKPVTDFRYLIGTYHLDDENGLLYKVLLSQQTPNCAKTITQPTATPETHYAKHKQILVYIKSLSKK